MNTLRELANRYWPVLLGITVAFMIMYFKGYDLSNALLACVLGLFTIITLLS